MHHALIIGNHIATSRELAVDHVDTLSLDIDLDKYDFIAAEGDDKKMLAIALQLRGERLWLGPLVSIGRKSPYANFELTTNLEFLNSIDTINIRHKLISGINLYDTYSAVLKYLFIYHQSELSPIRGCYNKQFFSYPLQHIFQIEYQVLLNIIDELTELGIIKQPQYFDSCLFCNQCDSEYLRFSENCPSCNSSNLIDSKFIHCFKCGYVADENQFIYTDGLRCSNCRSKLKLIGDDYDHPLESTKCLNCDELFIDGNSSVLCISCGNTSSDISKLHKHAYYSYQLSITNESKFISYLKGEAIYLFDKLNYASKDYFLQMLQWLIRIYQRHPDEQFGLLELQINLEHEDLNLRELALIFKNTLRSTDIYCSLGIGRVLILLPKTIDTDLDKIVTKISNLILAHINGDKSKFKSNSYTVDDLIQLDLQKTWFL